MKSERHINEKTNDFGEVKMLQDYVPFLTAHYKSKTEFIPKISIQFHADKW